MIPTILLTGFLGAGKTTLLNRLIDHFKSKRTALLINEFGKVGIDGELLVEGNYEKIELNKGSLFCICVRTDFIAEVERIARQIKPDLLIIEATGLADTSEMEKMLALPNLRDSVDLQACICLVDCQNFLKIKDILKAPVSQVRSADLVLVNKTDLVSEEQVDKVVRAVQEISGSAPVIRTSFAEFPLEEMDKINRAEPTVNGMPGEGKPDPVVSITLEGRGSFTQQSWEQFRSLVEPNSMRIKGFVSVEGRPYYVDATTDRFSMSPTDRGRDHLNRLVVIGQNLNQAEIETSFSQHVSA